jgi:hypothetical protein
MCIKHHHTKYHLQLLSLSKSPLYNTPQIIVYSTYKIICSLLFNFVIIKNKTWGFGACKMHLGKLLGACKLDLGKLLGACKLHL